MLLTCSMHVMRGCGVFRVQLDCSVNASSAGMALLCGTYGMYIAAVLSYKFVLTCYSALPPLEQVSIVLFCKSSSAK